MVKNLLVVALLLAASWARIEGVTPVFAQVVHAAETTPATGDATDGTETATSSDQASEPPFLAPLADLSEILGSMQFLRSLCGGDSTMWRTRMQALLDAQQPSEPEKRKLIASFNAGYRAFESTYRKCTPAALVAMNRYQDQGALLAREIGTRYGN